MNYEELLKKAPPHSSPEFLEYVKEVSKAHGRKVIEEDGTLLIVENIKYHNLDGKTAWYTVFFKCGHFPYCKCVEGVIGYLMDEYESWEWLKKSSEKQTVKRFHIHLIKK